MNLRKLIMTNNPCYKAGRTIVPKGIMVHSTGANNPYLKRYVGPDDGLLGENVYGNHWNQDRPFGRKACPHACIGKLADGSIATYQTLPWNHRGWHAGGTANDTHIGFEICEDDLSSSTYFNAVYKEAMELCMYLCVLYGLSEDDIITHSEGRRQKIASNHADVMHWFPMYGKSMDIFREDVGKALNDYYSDDPEPTPTEKELYRVRKMWSDSKTQKGAFNALQNAKDCADMYPGYNVYDSKGTKVYAGKNYDTYVVVTGDTLWEIARKELGKGYKYGEIKALNSLKSNNIYPGQVLKIPRKN